MATKKLAKKATRAAKSTAKAIPEGITRCGGKVAAQFKKITDGTSNALEGINRVVGEYIATGAEMTRTLPGKIAEAAVHALHDDAEKMNVQSFKNRKSEIALIVANYEILPTVITKLTGAANLSVEKHHVVSVLREVKKGAKVEAAVKALNEKKAGSKARTAKQNDRVVIEYICKAINTGLQGTAASKPIVTALEKVLSDAGYSVEEAA